ncbi:hypothetical protein [Krasilnikovia sp. M28-CT-15]|uniref:hypothetical protein n=1 Tax=Krasilnikovia sp. M28-CT-15 TaxID=3373540 RepID=UPI0038770774
MNGQRRYADDPEPPSWYTGPRATSGSGGYGRSGGADAPTGYTRSDGIDGPGAYGLPGGAEGPGGFSRPDGPGGYGLPGGAAGPGGYGSPGSADGPGGYGGAEGPAGYGLSGGADGPGGYSRPGGADGPGAYGRPGSPDEGGGFRLPEQRSPDDRYGTSTADPLPSTGGHPRSAEPPLEAPRQPVRGPEFPAVRPTGSPAAANEPASPAPSFGATPAPGTAEPTGVIPSLGAAVGGQSGADRVYRTRRPVSAVVVALATLVLMVPVVRLLAQATFADRLAAGSVVPAVLLTLGLPLTGVGLFALAGGGRPESRHAWLRPPVVYLPVGLLLVFAAAVAVG